MTPPVPPACRRRIFRLKYRLIPYICVQARECSGRGFPIFQTLFFEYSDDPALWFIPAAE